MQRWTRTALCLLLLLCLCASLGACEREEDVLRVHVLDAGQSDCILLAVGDAYALVDTGSSTERDRVLSQLRSLGVKELAFLLVTHPHEDHYGNARTLLERYPVGTLICADVPCEELGYSLLLETAEKEGVPIKRVSDGYRFSLDLAQFTLLCASVENGNVNDASVVLRVTYGISSLLFMGDVESEGEQALIDAHGATLLDCDFLKIGHHGSDTASSEAFLNVATPKLAAISCGALNTYGFPHEAVLTRLAAVGAAVYRTDLDGALTFVCDGKEVRYEE